jgi:type II secretory pathway component PulF
MPKYAYAAENADGIVQKGVQEAESLGEARLKLFERELTVTELAV